MTKLDCNVTSCMHNADNCCCKNQIMVDGQAAKEAYETCCGSFDENKGGAFTNLFKTPEKKLDVGCEAVNCSYNQGRKCSAEHIGISGHGASQASLTQCSSFRTK